MSGRFLQLSGIVVDLVHHVDHMPQPGEEVETRGILITAGGGFNAMQAALRFGVEVLYGGTLGTGMFAEIASRALAATSIHIIPMQRPSIDQGTCVVLVDKSGERSFISHHGAERKIDAGGLDGIESRADDWILLTGYSLMKPDSAAAILPWLLRLPSGSMFVFDPGPVVEEIPATALKSVLLRADWISANYDEAKFLTGIDDPAAMARSLSLDRQGAIVRTGADGCWLALEGKPSRHIPGFKVDAVDTNGAGDTHDGVFIAARCLGYGPAVAAGLANAAAALSTTHHGPATSPGLTETLSFMQSHGLTQAVPSEVMIARSDWDKPGASGRPQQGEVK